MKRTATLMLTGALVAAACSGSEPTTTTAPLATATTATTTTSSTTTTQPPTTTTTLSPGEIAAAELEADSALIKTLYRRYSDSWFVDLETAAAYRAEHTYPSLGCILETTLAQWAIVGVTDDFSENIIVIEETIERDDGWTMPIGPTAGQPVEGRVYIFVAEFTATDILGPVTSRDEVHATIIDGEAYFFFQCWDPALDA